MSYTPPQTFEWRDQSCGQIKRPVVIVTPHGHPNDDARTCHIACEMADSLECYLVSNGGYERASQVDLNKMRANFNDIDHCLDAALKGSFYDKIIQYKDECIQTFGNAWIILIHGMADTVRQRAKDPNLDIIVGYGAGSPHGLSCDVNNKNMLIYQLAHLGLTVYGGKKGGRYAGADPKNLNQLFRAHTPDPLVESVQLEIVYSLRSSDKTAEACGKLLAVGVDNFLTGKNGVPIISIKEH